MAIIACICTRAGLSVHLQLANIISSKSGRGSRSECCSGRRCCTSRSRFLILRLTWFNPGQTRIIFKPGLTRMTRTKRDPVDPDDPTRFQRWCVFHDSNFVNRSMKISGLHNKTINFKFYYTLISGMSSMWWHGKVTGVVIGSWRMICSCGFILIKLCGLKDIQWMQNTSLQINGSIMFIVHYFPFTTPIAIHVSKQK